MQLHTTAYQKFVEDTAIFPADAGMVYCTIALAGEAGELREKIIADLHYSEVLKELGDNLWYITALGEEFGWRLDDLLIAVGGRADPNITVDYSVAVSRICELMKKAIRGGTHGLSNVGIVSDTTVEKRGEIVYATVTALDSLIKQAGSLGFSLSDVIACNMAKLQSRRDRGVIHGTGDNR